MLDVAELVSSNIMECQLQFILAAVDDLPESSLTFSPVRVIVLVLWVYMCLYSIQRIEYGTLVNKSFKPYINVPALFIGPIIFLTLVTADIVRRVQKGELSTEDIFGYFWSSRTKKEVTNRRTIQLLDSAGKSYQQVCGNQDGSRPDDSEHLILAQNIIVGGLDERASDILIDPRDDGYFTVRFRVDGVLRLSSEIEAPKAIAVVNCYKAIAGMDISEKRRPQDGAFMARIPEGKAYFRIASAGVLGGEKVSIRVLDQSTGLMKLNEIGLSKENYNLIVKAVQQPSGMILICGPTGSGKTTSLYAMLGTIDFFARNVITVEDPIEHYLPHASQIEVNPKADITFSNTLKSILRQDPDIICVGEIRDSETADMSMQASQTGHLVLATFHSSSNMGTLVRLMDLGVKPLLISSAISIIISQRLVRRLCDSCKEPAKVSDTHAERFRKKGIDPGGIMRAKGCAKCDNTGYVGRLAIMDVMRVDSKLKAQLVSGDFSVADIKQSGEKKSRSTLRDEGLRRVAEGLTTLEEVKRITTNIG